MVVRSSLGGLAGSHGDILDHDYTAVFGSDLNPGSLCVGTAGFREFEIVVGVTNSLHPRSSLIGGDLQLGGVELGIDDGGREPPLRRTTVHANLKRSGDWARNILPRCVNLAKVLVRELGEHVGR